MLRPFAAALIVLLANPALAQQANPDADLRIPRPAYGQTHPTVLFDEAHFNVHTSGGRYKRFADLITNDGYNVVPNRERFSKDVIKGADVLIVVSALGADRDRTPEKAGDPAFTAEEGSIVSEWVRGGGRLLLIVDHEPTGAAAHNLAAALDVDIRNGTTMDREPSHFMPGCPGCIFFTRENGLLGDHPIMNGRDGDERVPGVVSGVGTSLTGPKGSTALLKLADTAYDEQPGGASISAAGRSQGLAFRWGKGRVVVLGEAALISGEDNARPGFVLDRWKRHHPGIDNRQFALNIMHWLSDLLE